MLHPFTMMIGTIGAGPKRHGLLPQAVCDRRATPGEVQERVSIIHSAAWKKTKGKQRKEEQRKKKRQKERKLYNETVETDTKGNEKGSKGKEPEQRKRTAKTMQGKQREKMLSKRYREEGEWVPSFNRLPAATVFVP